MTPMIETERVRLRGHNLNDFDCSAAMWADENVTRFIGGKPSSREDSWRRFQTYVGHWALMGHGFWLIEEKASGRFLGEGGFGTFKREIEPPFEAPEQGWVLAPHAHGKGYAHEAMRAAIAWGEQHFKRSDFVCLIAPENAASLKLAEKLGYREFGRAPYRGEPSVQLRRT
ncbi:MAG TPA: GNAT family N-acetyltransferase [Vitreimonas sp.]|uniref:GNAT family N-acetyltransferase n=1 Tax=Vitreimonas sp. TaxID=3069702 RepID=UPI002D3914D6|nr:GNAT family N-acetyltransferase [Vitreimonas sp.]HYD89399.1 GNAT family N-acetyltransferase [Vitreimonas sp.]